MDALNNINDVIGGAPRKKKIEEPEESNVVNRPDANATAVLVKALFRKRKVMSELVFDQPLNGIVSLKLLETNGFNSVETVRFKPGTVTHVRDIPPSVARIYIGNNHLETLDTFPDAIEYIDANNNHLAGIIDISKFTLLAYLNVSDNKITGFSEKQSTMSSDAKSLPSSLVHLFANHNSITRINLSQTPLLQTLELEQNPTTMTINAPDTIITLNLPPSAPSVHMLEVDSVALDPPQKISTQVYKQALVDYFNLRQSYYDTHAHLRQHGGGLPLCPGCGKAVGVVFSSQHQKHRASCGGTPPCTWNVTIFRGEFYPVRQVMQEMNQTIEATRDHIIRQKMDTLFEYITEENSVKLFDQHMKFYRSATELAEKYTTMYETSYFNENKANVIQQKLKKIQALVANTALELENDNVSEAVRIQTNEIAPISRYIHNLQYEMDEFEIDPNTSLGRSIHSQIALNRTEINVGESVSVKQ